MRTRALWIWLTVVSVYVLVLVPLVVAGVFGDDMRAGFLIAAGVRP